MNEQRVDCGRRSGDARRAGSEFPATRLAGADRRRASAKRFRSFASAPSALVVTDMRMPDGDGLQVMQGVRTCVPHTPVIFLTAYGSVPDAVQAIKDGACDYLQKPVSFDQLEAAAERFLAPRGREERAGSASRRSGKLAQLLQRDGAERNAWRGPTRTF